MTSVWFPARKTKCPHCDKEIKLDITVRVKPVLGKDDKGQLEAFDGQHEARQEQRA